MTNREAIEILNELKKCYLGGIVNAIDMAIEAVKSRESRLMTLEELETLQEDDVIWVEIKPVKNITCISTEIIRFITKMVQGPSSWLELHTTDSAGLFMTRKTTEPNWRCWTSRPTDEQREKEPWNGYTDVT